MCVFKSGSVYCSALVVCSLLQTFVQQTINQIIIVYSNFSLTATVYFSGGLHKIKFHFFSLGFKASQAVLTSSSLEKKSFLIFIFDLKQRICFCVWKKGSDDSRGFRHMLIAMRRESRWRQIQVVWSCCIAMQGGCLAASQVLLHKEARTDADCVDVKSFQLTWLESCLQINYFVC